jgi:hypothetical protein
MPSHLNAQPVVDETIRGEITRENKIVSFHAHHFSLDIFKKVL